MSEKRNDVSKNCDNGSLTTNPSDILKEKHLKCDKDIHKVLSATSLCAMDERWRNSQLSVHSMMVTDEEKYNYMGSNNSVCQEEMKCKRNSSLLQYKNNHGLSSTSCIDKEVVEGKTKTKVKKDFQEFSNVCVNVPEDSKVVKNKRLKKSSNFSKTNSSGKSASNFDNGKATFSDIREPKKKRKNSAKQGLILDVALLHDTDGKKKNSITGKSNDGGPKSSSPGPESKNRLSPSFFITPSSPCSSFKSEEGGSEASSVYHSTYFTPSEERRSSDVVSIEMQQDILNKKLNKIALLSVTTPLRTVSAMDSVVSKELNSLTEKHKTQRRPSAIAEDVFRTSLPYIPSGNTIPETVMKSVKNSDVQQYDMNDPDMLCAPRWGNVCGSASDQKDINDQTCRSNFGLVLSALCFILFLWYLGMVYSRFINNAFSLDGFDSVLTSAESEIIQEVVINISVSDF